MMMLSQVAEVLGGELVGADVRFDAVSTDSRKVAAGDLFVALRGEHFDGAAFVVGAGGDGAVAALVNADSPLIDVPIPVVYVDDTRLALGRLAAHWRQQFRLPLIAVTGSNGKTSVKEMLAAILRVAAGEADAVLATQGNLNNDIGMPLTLLKLRAHHRYAVIEMGMNHPGEIDYLTCIGRPDVALVNNASGAHLAGLGTVEAVARAKGEIFAGLGEHGVAVINADDEFAPLWRELAQPHRVLDFGLDAGAAVGCCWDVTDYGVELALSTPAGMTVIRLQTPGAHNARNALAATAAALAVGVSLEAIKAGLESFGGVAGRLQRKAGRCGATLIDDTYNANPASMRAAILVLAQRPGLRIFVMGDMGELGDDAASFHAEIGAAAQRAGIQRLMALGELSRHAVAAFGAGAQHFASIDELKSALDAVLAPDVTVLVKGSRFMKMERVVAHSLQQEETCCSH
ncbi:MAG: UDP-N-acetylmuramoyl-tripeptide--D-alanyl-D-alanine ligase [Nitrosomonadales bacterium]|nr:UDP-N-acetylmuramoyl-tripeptide--D-alanyl-D-alanine ligase [Nitrosomonadales bacterium]